VMSTRGGYNNYNNSGGRGGYNNNNRGSHNNRGDQQQGRSNQGGQRNDNNTNYSGNYGHQRGGYSNNTNRDNRGSRGGDRGRGRGGSHRGGHGGPQDKILTLQPTDGNLLVNYFKMHLNLGSRSVFRHGIDFQGEDSRFVRRKIIRQILMDNYGADLPKGIIQILIRSRFFNVFYFSRILHIIR
jgi:hypothetical protein